ncbi:DUF1516 family protein [Amphibacillus sediminis]|uniref:DUF1516 family protein n=1 Tax=Amphibacillus sediminis TaxID=360185 RepID=UPI00082BF485|nr:DUF1516 family protein [Amphibacillus sediminis]
MLYIHMHVGSWVLALCLFGLSWLYYVTGKLTIARVFHFIARINYLLIIFTGFMLFYRYTQAEIWSNYAPEVIVKSIAGLWVVVMLEWTLYRLTKAKPVRGFLVQLVVMLVIVLGLGFGRLPWGFLP